jgi:hypothetical protein
MFLHSNLLSRGTFLLSFIFSPFFPSLFIFFTACVCRSHSLPIDPFNVNFHIKKKEENERAREPFVSASSGAVAAAKKNIRSKRKVASQPVGVVVAIQHQHSRASKEKQIAIKKRSE